MNNTDNLKSIFNNLLKDYSIETKRYYLFTYECFKKIKYNNYDVYFVKQLAPYYSKKHQFYLNRVQTYNTFTTILRQLCKKLHYKYVSYVKYDKSKYSIIYNIYK